MTLITLLKDKVNGTSHLDEKLQEHLASIDQVPKDQTCELGTVAVQKPKLKPSEEEAIPEVEKGTWPPTQIGTLGNIGKQQKEDHILKQVLAIGGH